MGMEFQFFNTERVVEVSGGNGYTTSWIYSIPLNCTLKIIKMINFVFYHNKRVGKKFMGDFHALQGLKLFGVETEGCAWVTQA